MQNSGVEQRSTDRAMQAERLDIAMQACRMKSSLSRRLSRLSVFRVVLSRAHRRRWSLERLKQRSAVISRFHLENRLNKQTSQQRLRTQRLGNLIVSLSRSTYPEA